ncbi:MAG: LLM class flavin-dependent oxidoreductase [Nitrosopumilus sp.]|nr:LLM class flavin-dependent oxidoreductase [Nitrosopumilus sp.]MDF2422970.1 LLM class flavin-dependent oxidoreductase [Nitrosopumilus sp.]MDF2423982.1 LLM class flavin-dependent oxidoreductase [Nitrosopumilus sp.]MDF2428757.1 LLM class flavin-dependent oxidoreductase [Nitrosopumilus sp.]MDF2430112.1 LLM class flavin-dependent oxidoreductase [Nitrosopumilus sp.]
MSIDEVLRCSEIISNTNTDTVWVPETWGMENFSMLGAVSSKTKNQKIGSSIINIYSRSPSTVAMGAATVDTLSNGRLVLGLGTSSLPIVESFHGSKFEKPLQRMRESVDVIRLVLSGKQANYDGEIFKLNNFTLLIKPTRTKIPIYLAAINKKMVDLAWEIGDGVIFYLRPINEMRQTVSKMQSKKRIDVTCQLITCVSENSEEARLRAKKTIAFYVSIGDIYRKFLSDNGFKKEAGEIYDEFKKTGFKLNHELVTDAMLQSLAISGTPDECKTQLKNFTAVGIDQPILQFNPIGDTMNSFDLFKKTFLDE